ncbi:hypothetical protein VTN00DRAFT_6886 [Thermoascus crustaceus]|uniref:uncharacterized protein n=1 Tax=Thermoascus crustaceus TaxID=5088 RepID=UPI003743B8CF
MVNRGVGNATGNSKLFPQAVNATGRIGLLQILNNPILDRPKLTYADPVHAPPDWSPHRLRISETPAAAVQHLGACARAKFRSSAFKIDVEGQGREGRGSEVRDGRLTLTTGVVRSGKTADEAGARDKAQGQRGREEDKKRKKGGREQQKRERER